MRKFLEEGASASSWYLLHIASRNRHERDVQLLLEKGVGVDISSKSEGTALQVADGDNGTALEVASKYRHKRVVSLLPTSMPARR